MTTAKEWAGEQIEQLTREVWVAEQWAAADAILRLELENERLRQVLTRILDLYPYLHCVCGRTKDRIKNDVRVEARKLLEGKP